MDKERSGAGKRIYGRSADTSGTEVKVQEALSSPLGPRAWLITGGPSLRFDIPNTKRLVAALTSFVEESEEADGGAADLVVPAGEMDHLRSLFERTIAVADEWRTYAATLPDGPAKSRALQLAAAIYIERALSGLDLESKPTGGQEPCP